MRTVCHWTRQERVEARVVSAWQRSWAPVTMITAKLFFRWEDKSLKELKKSQGKKMKGDHSYLTVNKVAYGSF